MQLLRQALVIAMLLPLAACDEEPATITLADRRSDLVADDLWKLQDARGIPVEIHGAPFRRVSDADLAGAMKVPAQIQQDISFYATPTGGAGHAWRIVLHFNPQGPPNASRDCSFNQETPTNALPDRGFAMHFVICQRDDWKAHAFLEVRDIEDGDLAAFQRHIQNVISEIFREEKDR